MIKFIFILAYHVFKPLFYVFVLFSHGVADEDSSIISSAVMCVCMLVTPTQTMTCIIPKTSVGLSRKLLQCHCLYNQM